eukprot:1384637-Pyramimonas_sp.AAC.1
MLPLQGDKQRKAHLIKQRIEDLLPLTPSRILYSPDFGAAGVPYAHRPMQGFFPPLLHQPPVDEAPPPTLVAADEPPPSPATDDV